MDNSGDSPADLATAQQHIARAISTLNELSELVESIDPVDAQERRALLVAGGVEAARSARKDIDDVCYLLAEVAMNNGVRPQTLNWADGSSS